MATDGCDQCPVHRSSDVKAEVDGRSEQLPVAGESPVASPSNSQAALTPWSLGGSLGVLGAHDRSLRHQPHSHATHAWLICLCSPNLHFYSLRARCVHANTNWNVSVPSVCSFMPCVRRDCLVQLRPPWRPPGHPWAVRLLLSGQYLPRQSRGEGCLGRGTSRWSCQIKIEPRAQPKPTLVQEVTRGLPRRPWESSAAAPAEICSVLRRRSRSARTDSSSR